MRMVNARFPETPFYGFEMVDAPGRIAVLSKGLNQKFTPNQISAVFRRFSAF
jgi:hypothetical protein